MAGVYLEVVLGHSLNSHLLQQEKTLKCQEDFMAGNQEGVLEGKEPQYPLLVLVLG